MGAQFTDLVVDKVTPVKREFDTADGPVTIDLKVRHRRITNEVQNRLKDLATGEFTKLAESLEQRKQMLDEARRTGQPLAQENLPSYQPKDVTCLTLAEVVIDLDIMDGKKSMEPTYENLLKLPVELNDAILSEIMGNILPKKGMSTTSANGTPLVENEEVPQIG